MVLALFLFSVVQLIMAIAVIWRFRKVSRKTLIPAANEVAPITVSIVIPVLNEEDRILACLEAVLAEACHQEEIVDILVVDGGSVDETVNIVERLSGADKRLRLIDASPVPSDVVGKAWGLHMGLVQSRGEWVLTLDADTIIERGLTTSLMAFAVEKQLDALSIATKQSTEGPLCSILHPSFLTTLVYRFGPPGFITRNPRNALANGQCFFASKASLDASNAIQSALSSLCEDITIVRTLTRSGYDVGFFQSEISANVKMYSSPREIWVNWPRSLIMRDQYFDIHSIYSLSQVLVIQAAPLPLLIAAFLVGPPIWFTVTQAMLLAMRIGVLFGTRSGYSKIAPTFWLSPIVDLPVTLRLLEMTMRRRFIWRGRVYNRDKHGGLQAIDGDTRQK